MADQDIALVAHLMRRAGFGASRDEIEAKAAQGYDNVVQELLNPKGGVDDDILMRYNPAYYEPGAIEVNTQLWVYKMINNPNQLQEKVALFWHMIFCAGHSKIDSGQEMGIMVNMFREHGMGRFDDLLLRLSENPGMMYYLDNTESHKANLNENYGRELLELFSLGVGHDGAFNYSEDDVKVCARAFTGWNVAPAYPPFPHGRSPWVFRFDPADHDASEKTFLGETGPWNGDDIIRIICEQPGTARFLARHLYNFFVADEPQVPAWRLTPPRDIEAIQILETGLLRLRPLHQGHARGPLHLRLLQGRVGPLPEGQEPGRDGGKPAPHGRRAQGNQARPVRALPGAQVHGPGPDEPAHGGRLAHRPRVD